MPRATPLVDPVTLEFDGESIVAERGEPVAAALIAAGRLALARSPKFHRPRGPSCLRAACDGCLARVDDCPNVMTCMVPAAEGTVVKTQNTLGSRDVNFLRVTDWFFPKGMNHHELFAGVPGLQGIMQSFARRVAGLGKLPAKTSAPREARRRDADVVVVGGGAAGMAIAARAAEAGRGVELLDDSLATGGTLRALTGDDALPWSALLARFDAAVASRAIVVRAKTTAAALYGDDVLVVGDDGAEVVSARALVLAPGAHDGALAFEGNDLPGVMSARAASWLLARGITLGERVAVCVVDGAGGETGMGDAFARAATRAGQVVEVVRGEPLRAEGNARVKAVVVRDGDKERRLKIDALVLDAPRAPAYELCEQAGARLVHASRGFIPQVADGRIRDHIFALGEVTGAPLEPRLIEAQADAIAKGLPMTLARLVSFASGALLVAGALVACSSTQSPPYPLDASVPDGAPFLNDSGPLEAAPDAPLTTGTASFNVNGADYETSGDFLAGYGPTSTFNEAANGAIVNVELQWSGTGVGVHPCTYALVYIFAATSLSCAYEFSVAPDAALTTGTCVVTITSDGPNQGDPVVGTFAGSLPPNPNAQNIKSCSNPGTLSGSFTQPRPTSAVAGGP